MYCKKCFKKISSASKFCRYCGAPVKGDHQLDKKRDSGEPVHGHKGNHDRPGRFPVSPVIVGIVLVILLIAGAIVMVTSSSVFKKTESISYADYIGVWQERGSKDIEENGGVRLEIHGIDADTMIITMEFYGVADSDITVDELGAVIKDGKAYYSFTNDGYGNSGNGVLTFEGRDIEWKSNINKNEPVYYTVSKIASYKEDEDVKKPSSESAESTENKEEVVNEDDYILPNSDKAYVTEDELKKLTQEELRIARNEIMARHGRIFRDPTLDAYFRSKEWYQPTMEPDAFDSKSGQILNKYEMKNVALIKQMEE